MTMRSLLLLAPALLVAGCSHRADDAAAAGNRAAVGDAANGGDLVADGDNGAFAEPALDANAIAGDVPGPGDAASGNAAAPASSAPIPAGNGD